MEKHRVKIKEREEFNFSWDESSSDDDDIIDDGDSIIEEEEEEVKTKKKKKTIEKPTVKVIKLNKNHVVVPDRLLLLGASETGKTSLIRNIIKLYQKNSRIVGVYWFGKHANEENLPVFRKRNTINKKMIDKLRVTMKTIRKNSKNSYCIVVFDDILGESFHRDKWYDDFISSCRHEGIILIIGLQYIKSVPPVIRENVKRIIVTSSNNQTTKALYELGYESNPYVFQKNLQDGLKIGICKMIDLRAGKYSIEAISTDYCESL